MGLHPIPISCLRWPSPGVHRLCGRVNGNLQEGSNQGSQARTAAASVESHSWPPLHRRPSSTSRQVWSVSCGVPAPFSWVLVHTALCALPDCFPQSCGSHGIKSCWPSKSHSLGILSSFARYLDWEAWHRSQNFQNSERTSLVLLFSSLWVAHPTGIGFDFIVIAPILLFRCSVSFVFGHGCLFFGGFQHPPVGGCPIASCDFGVLTEDECTSFYSAVKVPPMYLYFRLSTSFEMFKYMLGIKGTTIRLN